MRQNVESERDGCEKQDAYGHDPDARRGQGAAQEREVVIEYAQDKAGQDDHPGETKAEARETARGKD